MSSSAAVDALNLEMQRFGWLDHSIFVAMLAACIFIGVYFGYVQKRRKKLDNMEAGAVELEHLLGGRKLFSLPVAMSLIATLDSGIALLGSSTEMYIYGTGFMMILISMAVAALVVHFFVLPVVIDLQLTSLYEYLEARFDHRMRLFGSILYTLNQIIWIPIVVYVPALSFNQVTGIDIHIITPITCLLCMVYTSVGGIKAVVWTDFVQMSIIYSTMILIVIIGTVNLGGFAAVIDRNRESGRIELPEFQLDPTIRHSIFSLVIGGTFHTTATYCVNQGLIQRYLSLPNLKVARRALWIFVSGNAILTVLFCYTGLIIYATYYECDPLTTKLAQASDQLFSLLVMDAFRTAPGLAGLFVSGIFTAALSSLSTGLNSLSAVVLEDFVKPCFPEPMTARQTSIALKIIVLIAGIICVALVFVVERMGSVLQLSMSLSGITIGPLLAIFLMGLLMPWINSKSVFSGGILGLVIISWITFKTQTLQATGEIYHHVKPVTTVGCTYNFTATPATTPELTPFNSIYHMSYLFYTAFGVITTIVISHAAMLMFGREDFDRLNPKTIAPAIRKYFTSPEMLIRQWEKHQNGGNGVEMVHSVTYRGARSNAK